MKKIFVIAILMIVVLSACGNLRTSPGGRPGNYGSNHGAGCACLAHCSARHPNHSTDCGRIAHRSTRNPNLGACRIRACHYCRATVVWI